jgi:hypothetical protein
MLVGAGTASLPALLSAADPRRLKIGCTTLIWGAVPNRPENLEAALKDMYELGYNGFETFASILEDWEKKGTLAAVAEEVPDSAHLRLHHRELHRSVGAQRAGGDVQRYAGLVKKYGGRFPGAVVEQPRPELQFRGETARTSSRRTTSTERRSRDLGIGTGSTSTRGPPWKHRRRPTPSWKPWTTRSSNSRRTWASCRRAAPMRRRS